MAGVLEELRTGIERLENQRESEKAALETRRKLAADQGLSLAASYSDFAICCYRRVFQLPRLPVRPPVRPSCCVCTLLPTLLPRGCPVASA